MIRMETIEAKEKRLMEERARKVEEERRAAEEGKRKEEEEEEKENTTREREGSEGEENPSTLATTRTTEDLGLISYSEGITGPRSELNVNSMEGRFVRA